MQMELGVNFRPAAAATFGFNADAIRALRPAVVRHVITDPSTLTPWIASAERHQLRVLWSIPIEGLGPVASVMVIDTLLARAQHLTAAIELDTAHTARIGVPTRRLEHRTNMGVALALALAIVVRQHPTTNCPVLLGTECEDGDHMADAWLSAVWQFLKKRDIPMERFQGLAITVLQRGRPPRRRRLAKLAARLGRRGLKLAFVRVGWPVGMPLKLRWRVRETYRRWQDVRTLDGKSRQRWLVEAYELARRLGASHFVVEPEPGDDGLPAWGLYDGRRELPDPAWYALQRRHDAHPSP